MAANVVLTASTFAYYGDGSPHPCFYENYEEPAWVVAGWMAPLANAALWLANAVAYLVVPRAERGPLRAARWSAALGWLAIPLLLFLGTFWTMISFFDCDH